MGLNRTPMSKVMAVWIGPELLWSISSVLIYYMPESEIRVKDDDHLNFFRASVVQFRASRYIASLNRTPMSKFMAVWILRELPCSIYSVSIYYGPESDIRVKSNDHLNFSRTSVVLIWASRWYIMGLNRTPMSKVVAVWIGPELLCTILSVSIYCAWIGHPSEKLRTFEFHENFCYSILSISMIYHGPQSHTHVKSYRRLNWPRASMINFERVDMLCAWIGH